MGKDDQWVTVENRKLKLSNLNKHLYPDESFTKAHILEYYLSIAPTMLRHIRGRPLTLIRYPDGIDRERFFQKQMPGYAPEWIHSVKIGEDKKINYMVANEKASLIWTANLAALEFHQMHRREPRTDQPDYMVFDLDPPEGYGFEGIVKLAFSLKKHIEEFGYTIFVKTTGGKGVHLLIPLKSENSPDEVFEAAKEIARTFIQKNKDETTLQIRKKARKDRVLIDIYRNRASQTIVSPYSLRARPGAPVSMPVTWQELSEIKSSGEYHLKNAVNKVNTEGDAWEGMFSYAAPLHTKADRRETAANVEKKVPDSEYYKSPEQLKEYTQKRDFTKTREPEVTHVQGEGDRFTLHRHHATRLHYDLRLEQDGVLKSWAVPKGLPPRPGVKRLAVQTEDHPLEYLTFEGEIPKHEYGGGKMWVYASGRYEITKQKKESLYFRLESTAVNGEYRMYKMKDKEWLVEKIEEPQIDWLKDSVLPMHGKSVDEPPEGDYTYEVKWDGIRALISLDDGELQIHTRNRQNVTGKFPELLKPEAFRAACGLFDSEIVFLDDEGRPLFQRVINRLKSSSDRSIQKLSKTHPVHCYVFDCLYLDGRALINDPLWRRAEWLQDVIKKGTNYRLSEFVENGKGLFQAVKKHNMEGIMAKKKNSRYLPGKRSDLWLKVKTKKTVDCLVIGYTEGSADRSGYFGALHLAEKNNGDLRYRGKTGTGFNASLMKEISDELKKIKEIEKPIDHDVLDEKNTTWIEPKLVVEVSFSSFSEDGLFREAVFQRQRPDLQE